MQSIGYGFVRQGFVGNQLFRQIFNIQIHVKQGDISQSFKPLFRRLRVARRCLVYHKFRNKNLKIFSPFVPPLLCDLLMRCTNQITT